MSNLISSQEMKELTGADQKSKQIQVLRDNGLRFTIRADGYPVLTWEAYNRQLQDQPGKVEFAAPKLSAV
jgi:hypothetical protein